MIASAPKDRVTIRLATDIDRARVAGLARAALATSGGLTLDDRTPRLALLPFLLIAVTEDGDVLGALGVERSPEPGKARLLGPITAPHCPQRAAIGVSLLNSFERRFAADLHHCVSLVDANAALTLEVHDSAGFQRATTLATLVCAPDAALLASLPPAFQAEPLRNEWAHAVRALHGEAFPRAATTGNDLIDKHQRGDDGQLLVLLRDGSPSGYVWMEGDGARDEVLLSYLAVRTDRRGLGLGKRLLADALKWAFQVRGAARVRATLRDATPASNALFHGAGFTTIESGVLFEKWLALRDNVIFGL